MTRRAVTLRYLTISAKGQITLNRAERAHLGVQRGEQVALTVERGRLLIRSAKEVGPV